MFRMGLTAATVICLTVLPCLGGEPVVQNPSFEADVYGTYPGVARVNGGKITGWVWTGSVGINPVWSGTLNRTGPQRPFVDNGATPDGRQVALLQNLCTLKQKVDGFKAGKRYVVTYYENARRMRRVDGPPRLTVTLNGETIVSEHGVRCVDDPNQFRLPYDYVESAPFTAPSDGAFELVFKTTLDGGVAVLLDQVAVRPFNPAKQDSGPVPTTSR